MSLHSFDTLLEYSVDGGNNYTELEQIKDIEWDGISITQADGSYLRVPQAHRVYNPGLVEDGVLSFNMHHIEGGGAINTLYTLRRTKGVMWRITYTDGIRDEFEGNVQRIGRSIPEDDNIMVPVEIKVTGVPELFAEA